MKLKSHHALKQQPNKSVFASFFFLSSLCVCVCVSVCVCVCVCVICDSRHSHTLTLFSLGLIHNLS